MPHISQDLSWYEEYALLLLFFFSFVFTIVITFILKRSSQRHPYPINTLFLKSTWPQVKKFLQNQFFLFFTETLHNHFALCLSYKQFSLIFNLNIHFSALLPLQSFTNLKVWFLCKNFIFSYIALSYFQSYKASLTCFTKALRVTVKRSLIRISRNKISGHYFFFLFKVFNCLIFKDKISTSNNFFFFYLTYNQTHHFLTQENTLICLTFNLRHFISRNMYKWPAYRTLFWNIFSFPYSL